MILGGNLQQGGQSLLVAVDQVSNALRHLNTDELLVAKSIGMSVETGASYVLVDEQDGNIPAVGEILKGLLNGLCCRLCCAPQLAPWLDGWCAHTGIDDKVIFLLSTVYASGAGQQHTRHRVLQDRRQKVMLG